MPCSKEPTFFTLVFHLIIFEYFAGVWSSSGIYERTVVSNGNLSWLQLNNGLQFKIFPQLRTKAFRGQFGKLVAMNVPRLLKMLWMILNIYRECIIGGT